ncbi:transcriptional adapter 1-like isoform X1 [Mytilus galloprovincialis]|uniref:transcriptional adapter 1-like isoform X1 n=2 Tax=Mytilus galloprovincialis TaxID=29158 RepID=UPI003F7B8C46
MSGSLDLSFARKQLQDTLGDDMTAYLQNLKLWFKQKISKEDFDLEARKLLTESTVHLHNEFLLAIMSRCQSLSTSLVPRESSVSGRVSEQSRIKQKSKLRRKSTSSRSTLQKFVPSNPVNFAPQATYKGGEEINFATRELAVPDISMVQGRMLVCAWETGLEDVSDTAVKLIMQAIEVKEGGSDTAVKLIMQAIENQLKNIISQVLSKRSGYKVREKKFKYAMGTQVLNPYLRHTSQIDDTSTESEATSITANALHIPSRKPPFDIGSAQAAEQLSTAQFPTSKGPVTLFELLETLQLHRSSIASHSVYAPAIERVIHKLWHPSREEINQEHIHHQEVTIKQLHSQSIVR